MVYQKDIIRQVIDDMMGDLPPQNPELPPRRSVSTYLKRLDRLWHGGWSWQWPTVIAGPENGGKTQFLYQLLASSLLSYRKPWLLFYSDIAGNFRPRTDSNHPGAAPPRRSAAVAAGAVGQAHVEPTSPPLTI